MSFQKQPQGDQQKSWKILQIVWNFIDGIQKKVSEIYETSPFSSNFYRKYRNTSLAILNNFQSIQEAVQMSQEYEVPLLCINIRNEREEESIQKNILNSFQNSQLLNQGFLVWISYRSRKPKCWEGKEENEGFLECYQNQNAYKAMRIKQLPETEDEIYKLLFNLRNEYYELEQKDQKLREIQMKKTGQQFLVKDQPCQRQQESREILMNNDMLNAPQAEIQHTIPLNQTHQSNLKIEIEVDREIRLEKIERQQINDPESKPKEINPQVKKEVDKNLRINYNEFGEYPPLWRSKTKNKNEVESLKQDENAKKKQE